MLDRIRTIHTRKSYAPRFGVLWCSLVFFGVLWGSLGFFGVLCDNFEMKSSVESV